MVSRTSQLPVLRRATRGITQSKYRRPAPACRRPGWRRSSRADEGSGPTSSPPGSPRCELRTLTDRAQRLVWKWDVPGLRDHRFRAIPARECRDNRARPSRRLSDRRPQKPPYRRVVGPAHHAAIRSVRRKPSRTVAFSSAIRNEGSVRRKREATMHCAVAEVVRRLSARVAPRRSRIRTRETFQVRTSSMRIPSHREAGRRRSPTCQRTIAGNRRQSGAAGGIRTPDPRFRRPML